MKLYSAEVSGNSYKIRLLMALVGIEYELVDINLAKGENRTESFLKINPRGQIPALEVEGRSLWDSQAILVYLARVHGGEDWLPTAPMAMADVMQWLAMAENELFYGLARARAVKVFGRPWDLAQCQEHGRAGLQVMEAQLGLHEWLALGRPTIADVACYPYVALAPIGEVSLEPYANVRQWMGRIEKLPGYVSMPGIEPV